MHKKQSFRDTISRVLLCSALLPSCHLSYSPTAVRRNIRTTINKVDTDLPYPDCYEDNKEHYTAIMNAIPVDNGVVLGTDVALIRRTLKRDKCYVMSTAHSNPTLLYERDGISSEERKTTWENYTHRSLRRGGEGRDLEEEFSKVRESKIEEWYKWKTRMEVNQDKFENDDNSRSLEDAPITLRRDKKFMTEIVMIDGMLLEFASDELKADSDVVLLAALSNINSLAFASDELEANSELLAKIREYGPSTGILLRNFGSSISLKEVIEISKTLATLDIEFPERFENLDILREIISNRSSLRKGREQNEKRNIAVILLPKADHNKAFLRDMGINDFIKNGYHILYYEIGDETDVYAALTESTANGNEKIGIFYIGAHSNRESMQLGAGKTFDETHLDLSDEVELLKYRTYLEEDSAIIIRGCSAGKGRGDTNNIANMFSRIFPQSTIFSSSENFSDRYQSVQFDVNGKVRNLLWESLYKIDPSE